MWSNQNQSHSQVFFDLLEALSPPARPALNCNDGSVAQEAKCVFFFFFLEI